MDSVRFSILAAPGGDEIEIALNGVDLRQVAGVASAVGPTAEELVSRPSLHFLGHVGSDLRYAPDGKTVLLLGARHPWALAARISPTRAHVIWSDFERPDARLFGLGPFVFERRAYEAALSVVDRRRRRGAAA